MTALTEADLDNAIADKRIFRVVSKEGTEVGRIFSDTVPVMPKTCTGNCNQGRMCDCVPDVEWTQSQIDYLRVIAWVGSPLVAVGLIALAALYLH